MNQIKVFKFRKINKYFIDSLVKGIIYFSPPKELNDPFDCRINIEQAIQNACKKLKGKEQEELKKLLHGDFISIMQDSLTKIGICSFSVNSDWNPRIDLETLMWSHYADEHKGVCVFYDIPSSFFEDDDTRIIGIAPVSYGANVISNLFEEVSKDLPMDQVLLFNKLTEKILTAKGPSWKYESEARMIRLEPGKVNIPKSFLKQIYFGLHASEDDISLVKDILNGYDNEVKLSRVIRTQDDFGIMLHKNI